jgi:hypothetical protein
MGLLSFLKRAVTVTASQHRITVQDVMDRVLEAFNPADLDQVVEEDVVTADLVDEPLLVDYDRVRDILTALGVPSQHLVERAQRLGFDAQGNRLAVDNREGPRTRGGSFFNPLRINSPVSSIALGELLAGAQEVGINNGGVWVAKYFRSSHLTRDLGNWCAGFCSWCLEQAYPGVKTPVSFGARRMGTLVAQRGKRVTDPTKPRQDDFLIHSRVALDDWRGHISVVVGFDDHWVYTIDGNVGTFPAPVRVFRQPLADPSRSDTTRFLYYARFNK